MKIKSLTTTLAALIGCAVFSFSTSSFAWQMKQAKLMTDWAQQVDPAHPLPEYPRPQMVRSNWLNLNGIWQFQAGGEGDAVPVNQNLSREILVPFPMESALSGVMEHHERSWYRRTFSVPANWSGQRILLHLDAVDWESEVFINGQSVGVHKGGYDPITYDITSKLSGSGPQELIVRVYDPTDNYGQPRGKQTLHPGGIMYTSSSGIWQTVWLEPVPANSIASLKLVPDIDHERLSVTAYLTGATNGITVNAVARIGSEIVSSISGPAGSELLLPVANPNLWSPTHPFLYDLDITISNAATKLDSVTSYFGMRKISLGKKDGFVKMLLNNEFVFQFGPLDQGFWPDGIYTAPTDLALKFDLEQEKAFGYNMVRKHIKVEPARWYYWADKLGLLVWQDMPSLNSYTGNPRPIDKPQFELELTRMIENLRNYPSIIMWVVFNEAQGQHDTAALVQKVKTLDPSRLVNQASGGNLEGVGDILDLHSYPNPSYASSDTQAVVCGEFGGVGLGITNHTWAPGWGYVDARDGADLTSRFEDFSAQLCDFVQNHGLSAAVYTEITDVEIELNGFLTYDRKVRKPILNRIQSAILAPLGKYQYTTILPTSESNAQFWKYTTSAPAANWATTNFDDNSWNNGFGGFGTAGTPGSVVRTVWNKPDIWLRRVFNPGALSPEQIRDLVFRLHHDEDVEIYLNGVLAFSASGYSSSYLHFPMNEAARAAFRPNALNTLAVHCRQTSGGQYIDVGLDIRSVLVPPPQPPAQANWIENGDGLRAEYFNGTNLANKVQERIDPRIDFNWGEHSPAPGISNENYSVRWSGQIQPRFSEGYTFHLNTDNGRRLWINGQLIIDQWTNDWDVEYAGSMDLVAGQRYDIVVEYFNALGGGSATLEWSSASQGREVIPTGVLFSGKNVNELPSAANLPPTEIVTNRAPLVASAFSALPLGSVRPAGWLLTQLEFQRDGLTGHAEELYSDLGTNSAWLGGTGEGWERGPYYFKGLISLAYVLDDAGLKQKAQKWMDWLLDHQRADGFIGPVSNDDWWPRMVATYALRDYYEATADPRVPTVLSNYFRYMGANLPARPLKDWGKSRAGDQMDVALWLYNRNGDTNLLSLVNLLKQQAYDWVTIFTSNNFMLYGTDYQPKHNVNVEQALKFPAVFYQLSHQESDREALELGLDHLMREHGMSMGINGGTEFLAGNSSIQGVELCASVEAMLSLETAAKITGDASLADRLEMITFNALPAGLANKIKGHQYYALANNVISINGGHGFNQDYGNATLPGPNSGYPCCRFNLHMGWPKYVQNSWAATSDGGLAALAYGPTVVNARVAGGEQVQITEETGYPFEEQIRFRVSLNNATAFPLVLRVPGWCSDATITVNGQEESNVNAGSFHRLERTWTNGDLVVISLPMKIETETGPSRSVAIHRGPLAYSLKIGEDWTVRTPDALGLGFDEFEIRPTTPWNYALELNPTNPAAAFSVETFTTPNNPFDPAQPSIRLHAAAKMLPEWTIGWRGTQAFEPPVSPVASSSALQSVALVPFGSQHLRVSWFPYLGKPAPTIGNFSENFDSTWSRRWTVFGGNWVAKSNSLSTVPASANGAKALAMATAFTNFTYEADVLVGAVGNAGLIFRVSKPDIGADAYCGYYVGINAESDRVEFGRVSNSWHSVTSAPMNLSPNTFYHLKVQMIGSQLRVFVGDMNQPLLDLSDSTFTSGMIGVRDYCSDGDRSISSFANLTVKEFASAPRENPRAWYPMENNALDATGNGNDGAISGAVTFPSGKLGTGAARFSGASGNFVTIPLVVSNDFSIGFWLKTTDTGGSGQWFNGKGLVDGEMPGAANDFGISLVGSRAAFGIGNPDTTILTTNSVNDGQWHHLAATRDSSSGDMRLYVDGILQAQATGPTGTRAAAPNLRIGAIRTLVTGSSLSGTIDDIQIFDRVFSAAEIPTLMNHAPDLLPVFDVTILAGRTLSVTNSATDVDLPAQSLSFDLVNPPDGATMNSASGVLTWRPAIAQSGETHSLAVRVTDNGVPNRSAVQNFNVTVLRPSQPALLMPQLENGLASLPVMGNAGPDYILEASTNLGIGADWIPLKTNYSAAPPFLWTDHTSAQLNQRFYRVRLAP